MAACDVKLLGASPSPYVNRVQIALNLKSIDFEFLEETFGAKSELLLKSNPIHKKMPVMIHNDKPICESLIIVQYIDEVWTTGPTILPSDPYDRAIARFWAAFVDDKWYPALKELRMAEGEEAKTAALEKLMEMMALWEDAFAKCGKGKGFFGGDCIGYLDIAFGSFLGWLRVTEEMLEIKLIDEAKTPGLAGWAERFCSHEAVRGVIPETEKLIELAKKFQAIAKAQSQN
ncbi:glutathione S-transferase U17-like [Actinidia eriantha]|uniref:glutathione S-transferase U17-like n=1 Tax=Actinidia eriantha TaxID=165200 RepID=UPI00258C899B|nr:glutathione S-transferase U17-like [Actinidia eriantha]